MTAGATLIGRLVRNGKPAAGVVVGLVQANRGSFAFLQAANNWCQFRFRREQLVSVQISPRNRTDTIFPLQAANNWCQFRFRREIELTRMALGFPLSCI